MIDLSADHLTAPRKIELNSEINTRQRRAPKGLVVKMISAILKEI